MIYIYVYIGMYGVDIILEESPVVEEGETDSSGYKVQAKILE